jgi:hypothetical protein
VEVGVLELLEALDSRRPASPVDLRAAATAFGISWPPWYEQLMGATDGGEGWIGESFVQIDSVADMISRNRQLEVDELAPGLVLFGGDGGGEAFAFDTRSTPPSIVMVPLVGLGLAAAIPQGSDLGEFVGRLKGGRIFERQSE